MTNKGKYNGVREEIKCEMIERTNFFNRNGNPMRSNVQIARQTCEHVNAYKPTSSRPKTSLKN